MPLRHSRDDAFHVGGRPTLRRLALLLVRGLRLPQPMWPNSHKLRKRDRLACALPTGALLFAATCFATRCLDAEGSTGHWQRIAQQGNFVISMQERTDSDLPLVKAEGVIPEHLYAILAVLSDVKRHRQWLTRMKRSELLDRPDEFNLLMYLVFDTPWPASDRDVVARIRAKLSADGKNVQLEMRKADATRRPPRRGLVRVERFRATATLRYLDQQATWVRYEIDIDPGGWLPAWLVRWMLKRIPLKTLKRLRSQLRLTRYRYRSFIERHSPFPYPYLLRRESSGRHRWMPLGAQRLTRN